MQEIPTQPTALTLTPSPTEDPKFVSFHVQGEGFDKVIRIPYPHYFAPDKEVVVQRVLKENGRRVISFAADVIFPSTDQNVRADHVNAANMQFAAWPAAHILSDCHDIERPRIVEMSAVFKRLTKPDETVRMITTAEITGETRSGIQGLFTAKFLDRSGREKGSFFVQFVAQHRKPGAEPDVAHL
jgi:hypothetical protein